MEAENNTPKGEVIKYDDKTIQVSQHDLERYGIKDPEQIVAMAKEVSKYVESNALSTTIQGGKYVLVEGWQFAAGLLGLIGRITSYDNQSSYEPITFKWQQWDKYKKAYLEKSHTTEKFKYFANAQFIRHEDGNEILISQAFAMCSNEEKIKHEFDEYSILSMAQTRALGKAARMSFAFLIKAAGYEPTPAEEMQTESKAKETIIDLPEEIMDRIDSFEDHKKLIEWSAKQTSYAQNKTFRKAVMTKKTELLQKIADAGAKKD